jgi:hypothetical protein
VQWAERSTGPTFVVARVRLSPRFVVKGRDGVNGRVTVRCIYLVNALNQRVDKIERGETSGGEAQQYVVDTEVTQCRGRGMRIGHGTRL